MSVTGIHAQSSSPSPEAVREARAAVVDILESNNDQLTKRLALRTLAKVFANGPINISNVTITGLGGQVPTLSSSER
jgi:hypothetical protein